MAPSVARRDAGFAKCSPVVGGPFPGKAIGDVQADWLILDTLANGSSRVRSRAFVTAGGTLMRGFLSKLLGDRGERQAERFLRGQGFRIKARQYRTRFGELDLVCLDGDCTVFVEVKTRRSTSAGTPEEAVTRDKQTRLTRMALAYLRRFSLLEKPARFDVVSIVWPEEAREPIVEHYRNAFAPIGSGQMFS